MKKIILFLSLVITCLTLTACKSDEEKNKEERNIYSDFIKDTVRALDRSQSSGDVITYEYVNNAIGELDKLLFEGEDYMSLAFERLDNTIFKSTTFSITVDKDITLMNVGLWGFGYNGDILLQTFTSNSFVFKANETKTFTMNTIFDMGGDEVDISRIPNSFTKKEKMIGIHFNVINPSDKLGSQGFFNRTEDIIPLELGIRIHNISFEYEVIED